MDPVAKNAYCADERLELSQHPGRDMHANDRSLDARDESEVRRATPPGLTWLTITRVAVVLALLSHVFLYSFATGFLDTFGTDPEELGLTESAFLIRAGLWGALVLGIACSFAFIVFIGLYASLGFFWITIRNSVRPTVSAVTDWTRHQVEAATSTGRWSGNRIWSLSKTGRDKRAALLLSLATAAPIVALGMLVQPYLWGSDKSSFLLLLVLLSTFFNVLARRNHYYVYFLTVVMLLGLSVEGLIRGGAAIARDVQKSGQTSFPLVAVGLRADPVAITWLFRGPAEGHPQFSLVSWTIR